MNSLIDAEPYTFKELFEEKPLYNKYKEVWSRVHLRVLTTIRISKLMKNLKTMNSNTLRVIRSNTILEDYLKKTENIKNPFDKTLENKEVLSKFMFHPNKGFKVFWNIGIGLCLIYTATVTPFLLAFCSDRGFDLWFYIDISLTFVFALDILVTFNTALTDFDGTLISSRNEIVKKYLRSWFLIDVISCIPFDLILILIEPNASRSSYNVLSKLVRLKNLPRLFRLSKILTIFKKNSIFAFIENVYYCFRFSETAIKLVNTILMILISLHIVSCLWYFIAQFDESSTSWVFRKNLLNLSPADSYAYSLYWACVTLSTTGYGDITPKTTAEIIIAIIWMIVAFYFMSFAISSLSAMISEKDSGKAKQIDKKLVFIDSYAKENNIQKSTKMKMQRFVKEASEKNFYQFSTREKILNELTPKIRMDIALASHLGAVKIFPVLCNSEEKFLYTIVPLLKSEYMNVGRILYNEGDPCRDIYFMIHGKAYYICDALKFKVVVPGCYCGDIEVINNTKRIFTVSVTEQSVFWILTSDLLKRVQSEFPSVFWKMKDEMEKRFNCLIRELSEMKALRTVQVSDIRDVKTIRKAIEKEYEKLCQEYRFEENQKNNVSRIDAKLDSVRSLLVSNGEMLSDIEKLMQDIARIKGKPLRSDKTK